MTYPTARRHPRSLAEAFPKDYADPFHRQERIDHIRELNAAAKPWELALLCAGIAAFLIFGALALLKG